jgi:hypothetical protein
MPMQTTFSIWYMKPEFFRDGVMGKKTDKLTDTHVHLKDVTCEFSAFIVGQLEDIWSDMQAERWSPNGEAADLIKSKGLEHTSMSVGDVIVTNGRAYVAAMTGFEPLPKEVLPPVVHPALPKAELDLLDWLGRGDYSQYGECFGDKLNHLLALGLAQIHGPGEHQGGFIAQDHTGTRGLKYRAVSVTDAGRALLNRVMYTESE